jgi:hypothetical protein
MQVDLLLFSWYFLTLKLDQSTPGVAFCPLHFSIPLHDEPKTLGINFSRSRNARGGLPNPPLSAGFGNPAGANRDLLNLLDDAGKPL